MVWEDWRGNERRVSWGELQELADRFANVLREHGVERGDRVAMLLPATPETAAAFFGTWKLGAILLSMSVLYGDEGIRAPAPRLAGQGAGDRRRQRRPLRGAAWSSDVIVLDDALARRRPENFETRRHGGRRPGAALLLVGHDRAGQGHPARASIPAGARGVHLLPRRPGGRALPRHGRVGVGGRHRAAAGPVAAGRDAVRLPAPGRLRPRPAAGGAVQARGHERLHDADGDAGDDGHRGRRHALPAAVPRSCARPASRSTPRRSAGSASSTG